MHPASRSPIKRKNPKKNGIYIRHSSIKPCTVKVSAENKSLKETLVSASGIAQFSPEKLHQEEVSRDLSPVAVDAGRVEVAHQEEKQRKEILKTLWCPHSSPES
jgi:hypothetical protein